LNGTGVRVPAGLAALALWRGEPLADVSVLQGHPAVTGLAERRAAIVMEFAAAACGIGWHDEAVPHLRALAADDPLNERVHARLMIALAGSGRQAEALRIYERLRRRLDDLLGVMPGADLADA
jgi:DNA-binding SARP family transcriptional activator